mgnify:CR=1 FL=1
MSQKAEILAHLQAGNSLTVVGALSMFGCYALSQRIGELKRDGHVILTKMVETKTSKKQIASYRLAEIN